MIEVVVNQLSADGMKFVRVISDRVVSEAWMRSIVPGVAREFAQVHCYDTSALSLFYGEVTYPLRGVVEVHAQLWKKPRRFAGWRLMPGERASQAIHFLDEWYFVKTHRRAAYAFMKSLPKDIESGTDVNGLELHQAEWCLDKCVLVGG